MASPWAEGDPQGGPLVAMQRVEQLPLLKIPHLQGKASRQAGRFRVNGLMGRVTRKNRRQDRLAIQAARQDSTEACQAPTSSCRSLVLTLSVLS